MSGTGGQPIRHLSQENIRLREDNQLLKGEVEKLHRALENLIELQTSVATLTSETNVFDLVNEILLKSIEAVDSENGSLLLLDKDKDELVFVEVLGAAREKLLNYRISSVSGIVGWCIKNKKPRLVENVKVDPLFNKSIDQFTGMKTKSIICVPLLDGENCLGAIEVVNTRSGLNFSQVDLNVMTLAANLSCVAITRAENF